MKKLSLATILVLSTVSLVAQADGYRKGGFQGGEAHAMHQKGEMRHQGGFFNSTQTVSKVSEAGNWLDDQYVILEGKIINQVGKDDFIFKDDSGELVVEIERKAWQGQTITPNDSVKIYAEVDKSWNKTEAEVHRIEKLNK